MAIIESQKLNNGYAYKIRPGTINIRSAPNPTDSTNIVGTFPSGNFYFYYTEVRQSTASSSDYFVKIASDQDYTVGWVACSSGGTDYIYYNSSQNSDCYTPYYTTETSGYADAKYYWPNVGDSSYSYQTYERRETKGFYLLSSLDDNIVANTKANIVLTIKYNNGSADDSQTGQTWTETTYNFAGWDRTTTAPDSLTSGSIDHYAGEYRSSLNDESFYAVYTEGTTSDPKYSNNTKSLGTPSKTSTSDDYTVSFNTMGGNAISSQTVTKTITYKFKEWTGSTGVSVSGTSCTFTQSGTVTASYTPTTTPAKVASMPIPTKPGYEFLGWGTSADQTTDLIAGGESSPEINNNITYVAIWKVKGTIRIYTEEDQKYRMALPYLHDGTRWRMAIPYLHNGTKYYIVAG